MGHLARCYTCQTMNLPMFILNKEREVRNFNDNIRHKHSCALCNGRLLSNFFHCAAVSNG